MCIYKAHSCVLLHTQSALQLCEGGSHCVQHPPGISIIIYLKMSFIPVMANLNFQHPLFLSKLQKLKGPERTALIIPESH